MRLRLLILGKEIIVGEKDKNGKKVVVGLIDSSTGKGSGIYTEPDPIFERN